MSGTIMRWKWRRGRHLSTYPHRGEKIADGGKPGYLEG